MLRPTLRAASERRPSSLVLFLNLLFWLTLGLSQTGCIDEDAAHLLNVIDVVPREVEVGDHIEILGSNLPSGESDTVRVDFNGTLHRPGKESLKNQTIRVEQAKASPDKVMVLVTESVQASFCGKGDNAKHTTFEGNVTVTFPSSADKGRNVIGRVLQVRIDFRPPSARRVVMNARTEAGERALTYFGLNIEDDSPPAGGLKVAKVRAASPADNAGIEKGDIITRFEGVTVLSVADMLPRTGQRLADVVITRGATGEPGSGQTFTRQISTAGFTGGGIPSDILAAIVILGIAAFILLLFMAPTAGIITWVERRVSARMQSRIGPNRAGPQGFLVWLADGLKSIVKEDIVPTDSDEALFRLAPYLVFIGVSATFVVMPFGQYLIAADLDIGILFVIAVTSLVAIGLMTGGWAANNKWSLLGGIRAAAQVISYEIPAAVAIVCIVMMTGSLRMQDIILAQGGPGGGLLMTGGWPWYWYMFRNPATFVLFFLFFTTALAEGNRAPFDLPEAESELVAGYSTEYSGMRYLFFFFAEWANVFVFCGISAALFLGGWQIPGVSPAAQEASIALQLLGLFLFLLKSWILIFIVVWIRWTLPRVRIDQLMNLCWKWFVPISFGLFGICAGWILLTSPIREIQNGMPVSGAPILDHGPQVIIASVTLAVFVWVLVHFTRRVIYNFKQSKVPLHLNPFI